MSSPDTARRALLLCSLLFVVIVGGSAATTLWRMAEAVAIPGPNSTGESGKVYFALRLQRGESIFQTAERPPHYPSIHGPLTHAAAGVPARLFDLEPEAIYYVGRAWSLLSTIAALLGAAWILGALGVSPRWGWAVATAFFASELVSWHAISYRPDTWNLAIAVAACVLLLGAEVSRRRRCLLLVLPTLAFFVKAPGLALGLPIALGVGLRLGGSAGLLQAAASAVCALAAILALNAATAGAFVEGLGSGLRDPVGVSFAFDLMREPQHWMLLFAPALGLPLLARSSEARRIVWVFWASALAVAFAASLRAGSGLNYFAEAYLWGAILCATYLADRVASEGWLAAAARPAIVRTLLIFATLHLGVWVAILRAAPVEVALERSRRVGPERSAWADAIDARGWRVWSDDDGLNALLEEPQVLYPLLRSFALRAGVVDPGEVRRPFEAKHFDRVLIAGPRWNYRGIPSVDPEIWLALAANYERVPSPSAYAVYRPKTLALNPRREDRAVR